MSRKQTRAYRFETLHHSRDSVLSLSPLNSMLTTAQKDLPPSVDSTLPEDAAEELASNMIVNVKRQFKCSHPAHWIGSSLKFGLKETAGTDV